MLREIRKVAVLGAGTMGARIAAHLANASIPALLLDIIPREPTPEEQAKGLTLDHPQVRNRLAMAGLEAALK
ncbi:MAG: 3-hydroxyacyl-CoA dehydrogenase, partial [Acidobacteria bacterium]